MTNIISDEQKDFFSNIFSDYSFERDRQMDGRTEPLILVGEELLVIEVLWRIWESSLHISDSFPVIFASFTRFSTRA